MKKILNKHPVICLLFLQCVLLCIGFNKIIFQPNNFLFANQYDGLKNYFTFQTYLSQDKTEKGLFFYNQMNYPYGEYIFFTDNTPAISVPLKWINEHLINIEAYGIAIYNYIFVLSILLTTYLAFSLLKPILAKKIGWTIFIAIAVSWLNPQFMRLFNGHYNLSLAFVPLLTLIILRRIYLASSKLNYKEIIWLSISIFFFIILSGLFHLYYIPLITYPIFIFCLGLFLHTILIEKKIKVLPFIPVILSTISAGLVLYFFIRHVDAYSDWRSHVTSGFDWIDWCLRLEALITPYDFNSIVPTINTKLNPIHFESFSFIGNFTFYGLIVLFLYALYSILKSKISFSKRIKDKFKNPWFFSLLFTLILSFAMACGSYIKLVIIPLSFDNIFFPFYFLKGKIDLITHFRCLARFAWIGWWILLYGNVWAITKINRIIKDKNLYLAHLFISVLFIMLTIDTFDFIQFSNRSCTTNPLQKEKINSFFDEIEHVDFKQYQAIYTIPMTQVGSEVYQYTLDDNDNWTTYWMQLVEYSGLPTFNCKMSRTALPQAQSHFELVLKGKIPSSMQKELDDRPILVVHNPKIAENLLLSEYHTKDVINAQLLINTFEMDTLFELNGVYFLQWELI